MRPRFRHGSPLLRRPLSRWYQSDASCRIGRAQDEINAHAEEADMRFKGKVALITAAASGIGRATANIIGREGGRIAAVDNNRERLDATVAEIAAAGGEVHPYNADALDAAAVDSVVADAARRFGRIDILVNAVGGSTIIAKPGATTEELTLAEWQALLHFNLTGTFLFTHAAIPIMKRQKSGKIINLASIAGRGKSTASSSAYATAKGGIIALTTKLAGELGPFGINVNAIAPATTLTERIRPRWEQRPPEEREADIARTPLRRMGEAVDQANVICFLASAHADFVTGLTIDVTGGL
jgi:NAD(P)-dependent dehydrogenase (short-subunit alcohol dehydrogenase family)